MTTISPDKQARLKAYLDGLIANPLHALEDIITIKPKVGGIGVPFTAWPSQQTFIKHRSRINAVVKIRQQGFTVVNLALFMVASRLAYYYPELRNRQRTIYTKSDEDTSGIFNHIRFMDAHLRDAFKGEKAVDSAKALHYADTGCLVRVVTAGQTYETANKKGRSQTDFEQLITEAGYIEHLSTLIGSTAIDGPQTMETTSSGAGGFFSQYFLGILQNGNEIEKNVWAWEDRRAFFFSFVDHPEYVVEAPTDFRTKDVEEERLMKLGAPPERVMWRRRKLADLMLAGKGDVLTPEEKFKREYPATWEDAFEESGKLYYNQARIKPISMFVKEFFPSPLETGLMHAEGGKVILCPVDRSNFFTIWRVPAVGWKNRYIAFADVGQGLATSDYDVCYVGDLVTREVVAMFRGRYGAERAAEMLLLVGAFYGAIICWDTTGLGAECRPIIKSSGYKNVWSRVETKEGQDTDPLYWGLIWNKQNKPESCGLGRAAIQDGEWQMPNNEWYNESRFFGFPNESANSPEAQTGFFDDCITAFNGLMFIAERSGTPKQDIRGGRYVDKGKLNLRRIMRENKNGKGLHEKLVETYGR